MGARSRPAGRRGRTARPAGRAGHEAAKPVLAQAARRRSPRPAGDRGASDREHDADPRSRGLPDTRRLFQTPEYARAVFDSLAEFRGLPATTDAAVEKRMRRQEALYDPEKWFRFILCEAALYHRPCPADVMAEQLDRLYNLVGQKRIELGIIPFGAQLRRTAPRVRAASSASDRPCPGLSGPLVGNLPQRLQQRAQSRAIGAQARNRPAYRRVMAHPMHFAALYEAGDTWLAECSEHPALVHAAWEGELLASIPSGDRWLVAESRLTQGWPAASRLRDSPRGHGACDTHNRRTLAKAKTRS
ncbi:Scr1 family TA system antitoxin-like transcriptional regulator [Streptomyces sp. CG1]|uniref:Scr1 family TA system antitoxin-like transcriptional regulator n=1 Tax=Streptomyces sp. CG1 TaxID=1287523 RepID=UPI0034E2B50A